MANYFSKIFNAVVSLGTGLKVTGKEFFTKKVTEEYPDNRDTLVISERFAGTLEMPHDENGDNKCIACGICQNACPNGTIRITSEMVQDPETGKSKKKLVRYEYDLGQCMFCRLCVNTCPTKAIQFTNRFEHAVFQREKLVKVLNR